MARSRWPCADSAPAAVHGELLRGAHPRIVGRQEQHHRRDVFRLQPVGQALVAIDLGLGLGRDPQALLPLGHHPARRHRVDADAVAAQRGGRAARQPVDRRLGDRVAGVVGRLDLPADRAEVDDGPAAEPLHARHHRLHREQRGALVDGDAVVVERRRHLGQRVAGVAGDVVDEHMEVAEFARRVGDRRLQRLDVAHIAAPPPGPRLAGARQCLGERTAVVLGHIDERHLRTLRGEGTHQRLADARAAAGDEHRAVAQAGVLGGEVCRI